MSPFGALLVLIGALALIMIVMAGSAIWRRVLKAVKRIQRQEHGVRPSWRPSRWPGQV